MKKRIHIFGASGSGTTTIAQQACSKLGYRHFDSDNYFWLQTAEPFTEERPGDQSLSMMEADLSSCGQWILSGSLTGWGDSIIPHFDLVVFVYVPQEIRISRLENRELERYGSNVLPGGSRYESCREFIEWAAAYDSGTRNGRSLLKHEAWLAELNCPTIRITNLDLAESVEGVITAILA